MKLKYTVSVCVFFEKISDYYHLTPTSPQMMIFGAKKGLIYVQACVLILNVLYDYRLYTTGGHFVVIV